MSESVWDMIRATVDEHETVGDAAETLLTQPDRVIASWRQHLHNVAFEVLDRRGEALAGLELTQLACLAVGLAFEDRHVDAARDADDTRVNVLRQLWGTSVETGGEVVALLRSGYATGALARWRLVREAAVLSLIVAGRPRDVAELYWQHTEFRRLQRAWDIQAASQLEGTEGLTNHEVSELKRLTREVEAARPHFAGDYGWAHDAMIELSPRYRLSVERGRRSRGPTFADLEHAVGWRPIKLWHALANESVHATLDTTGAPLRGAPHARDIDLPARLTAEELFVSTGAFVLSWPSPEEPDPEFGELVELLHALGVGASARFSRSVDGG